MIAIEGGMPYFEFAFHSAHFLGYDLCDADKKEGSNSSSIADGDEKRELAGILCQENSCWLGSNYGNVALLYLQQYRWE